MEIDSFNECIRAARIIPDRYNDCNDLGDIVILMQLDQDWSVSDWNIENMHTFVDSVREKISAQFMIHGEWGSCSIWDYNSETETISYDINSMGVLRGTFSSKVDAETVPLLENLHELVKKFKLTGES